MEDIQAIAEKTLEAEMPLITARAVARMAAKDTFAAVASNSGSSGDQGGAALLGLLVNVAAVATERADTRSWFTLPGDIYLARLPLPPGEHTLKLELHSRDGHLIDSSEIKVTVRKGEKTYISRHWIPSTLEVRP